MIKKLCDSINKGFLKYCGLFFSVCFAISTAILSFIDLNQNDKYIVLGVTTGTALLLCAFYIFIVYKNKTKIKINQNNVLIEMGDIFNTDGLSIIGFNEYFDTLTSNGIIQPSSLNGIFVNKCSNVAQLDTDIANGIDQETPIYFSNRPLGKTSKYPLGTCSYVTLNNKKYLLLALSHFDKNNNAYSSYGELMYTFIMMWKNICRYYNGDDIYIPLLATGIIRINDFSKETNDVIICILKALTLSRVSLKNDTKIHFLIHKEEDFKNIDYIKIKRSID